MAAYDIFHLDAGKKHRRVIEPSRLEDDSTHGGWLCSIEAPGAEAAVELALADGLLVPPSDSDERTLLVVPTKHLHAVTIERRLRWDVRGRDVARDVAAGLYPSSTTSASTGSSS